MNDRKKKEFDLAADTVKQLITLSTAIITLIVTVFKDILKSPPSSTRYILLCVATSLASIVAGCSSLFAMTGLLAQNSILDEELSVNSLNVRIPALIQVFMFVLSMSLLLVFAIKSSST